jgi:hypothetical protein
LLSFFCIQSSTFNTILTKTYLYQTFANIKELADANTSINAYYILILAFFLHFSFFNFNLLFFFVITYNYTVLCLFAKSDALFALKHLKHIIISLVYIYINKKVCFNWRKLAFRNGSRLYAHKQELLFYWWYTYI